MPSLPTLYAYRDDGPVTHIRTNWRPRRVYRTTRPDHSDQPGELCAVKFAPGAQGAAAMISEVVSRELMRLGRCHMLEARIVEASRSFVASWNDRQPPAARVEPGPYFGTRFRPDFFPGPPESLPR